MYFHCSRGVASQKVWSVCCVGVKARQLISMVGFNRTLPVPCCTVLWKSLHAWMWSVHTVQLIHVDHSWFWSVFLRTESYEYLWVFSFPLLYFFTCWCRLSRLDNKQSENLGLFWHNFAFLETCCIGISALTLWVVSICTKSDQTCSFVENALWDEHVLQKPNCYQRVLEYTLIWTCRACRCVRIRFHLAKARNWWSAARIGFGLSSTLFFLHFMRVSMHSRCYAVRT